MFRYVEQQVKMPQKGNRQVDWKQQVARCAWGTKVEFEAGEKHPYVLEKSLWLLYAAWGQDWRQGEPQKVSPRQWQLVTGQLATAC